MPIIGYICDKCHLEIDNLQPNSDPVPMTCPNDGEQMHKQFSVPAFCFKNGAGTDMGLTMSIPNVKRTSI